MSTLRDAQPSFAQLAEGEIDFRNLDTTSDPDTNLLCPICHCLFLSPVQLPCQHVFCSDCLESTPNEPGPTSISRISCPSCRRLYKRTDAAKVPKLIERILDDVVVRCPLKDRGCQQTVPRSSVENHVRRYCHYAHISCVSESCNQKIERRLATDRCLHQLTSCDDCSKELLELELEKHRRNSCTEAYEACLGCAQIFRVSEMQSHSNGCTELVIPCGGAEFGCKFVASRQHTHDHENNCPLYQAGSFLSNQVARIDQHEDTIRELRLKNRTLAESVTEMHSTIRDFLGEDSTNTHAPADSSAATNPPFDSQVDHLLELHTSLEDQIRRIESAVAALDARLEIQTLNHNLRASEERLHRDAVESQMRRQLQWLVSAKLQSQRAASSVLKAAGGEPARPPEPAAAGPSGANLPLRRRSSEEMPGGQGVTGMPMRRSSDSGREKL